MVEKNPMPTGVKIIAILYWIGAALGVLGGLGMLIGGGAIGSLGIFGAIGGAAIVFVGIVMIAFAALQFFIGKGLWGAKNWARVAAVIVAVLGALGALFGLGTEIVGNLFVLIIHSVIGGYLWFNKEVRSAFGAN